MRENREKGREKRWKRSKLEEGRERRGEGTESVRERE